MGTMSRSRRRAVSHHTFPALPPLASERGRSGNDVTAACAHLHSHQTKGAVTVSPSEMALRLAPTAWRPRRASGMFRTPPRASAERSAVPAGAQHRSNELEALRSMTRLVVDTGDLAAIARHSPTDATTNPTLLLKASKGGGLYRALAMDALASKPAHESPRGRISGAADELAVRVGLEILNVVPGRVSTEVDARLSYDAHATVQHALRLVELYEQHGVDRERLYLKIAATWEGVQAVAALQRDHRVDCNCTLIFSLAQAVACADAGAALVSPFVGRILDWYQEHSGQTHFSPEQDPGVIAVKGVYNYFKAHDLPTVVMAASFRNLDQIRQLAGCDAMTLSPLFLDALAASTAALERSLAPQRAAGADVGPRLARCSSRAEFEARLGAGMARDKLEEGVALFSRDAEALEAWLAQLETEA